MDGLTILFIFTSIIGGGFALGLKPSQARSGLQAYKLTII